MAAVPLEGLPVVAVVGRPNVGKSTLFNRIVGERQAIVEDRARTTRDRLYAAAEWNGRRFVVVDTGGLERRPGDPIEAKVQEQARLAIAEADAIVFVVDAAAGATPADLEAAESLRAARAPVLVAVNKADSQRLELEGAEFHRLGWPETYAVSALHGRGVADLLDALVWALPPESAAEAERKAREAQAEADALTFGDEAVAWSAEADAASGTAGAAVATGAVDAAEAAWDAQVAADVAALGPIAIAIVGRPNVGKSSLLNALLGQERAIVSEIAGTTRDTIDTALDWHGQPVRLLDTAGLRRRGKAAGGPAAERYSSLRALKAINRADVAVLVLDAQDGLAAQDAHVAGYVVDEGRGLVVAVNKWDLVEGKTERTFDEFASRLRGQAPFLDFAPIVSISARTGQRVGRVLEAAVDIAAERRRRVATAELNRLVSEATFRQAPPAVKGRRPRILFATQASVAPPTFVFFARDAASVHFSYRRYLENELRKTFGFDGTPLRLVFRERSKVRLEPRRRARR
ncbi:MAG TPA: ribosome biogenesis GTPase Der [Candidatus Dormibacteraeota bacterium]|nr:ribosome biogenesis GTPase Der [Candidatus Dormibacteraeota bacterium]